MKERLIFWITLGLLTMLLVACSLVGSKKDTITCTGTQLGSLRYPSQGEIEWVDGQHISGIVMQYDQESSCPELSGVMTLTADAYNDAFGNGPFWGSFQFETAYAGGGTWEGTLYGETKADGKGKAYVTSFMATGSLSGVKLTMTGTQPAYDTDPISFDATIENLPEE